MPEKRSGTHRVTTFLPDNVYENMNNYIATYYTADNAYGARSEVISSAVSCFCSNMNNRSSCGVDINHVDEASIRRLIEKHKDTLDKLGDEEVKQ